MNKAVYFVVKTNQLASEPNSKPKAFSLPSENTSFLWQTRQIQVLVHVHFIIHEYLHILDGQAMPKVQELNKHLVQDALIGFAPSSQLQIPWISLVAT